jgi:hypothetical protein
LGEDGFAGDEALGLEVGGEHAVARRSRSIRRRERRKGGR